MMLSAIDARIQAGFNIVAFALMRTLGVGKAFLRYAFYAMVVAAASMKVALPSSYDVSLFNKVISGAIVVTGFLYMHLAYHADTKAEEGNTGSISDTVWTSMGWLKALPWLDLLTSLPVLFIRLVYGPSALQMDKHPAVTILQIFTCVGFLSMLYLAKTPNKPPPRKDKKTSMVKNEVAA